MKSRAGTRGISSSISPAFFNQWWTSAELRFFNEQYDIYARTQSVSDSISKWMTDAMILAIPATGIYTFPSDFNLLHVDSMSAYLPATGTSIASFKTLVPGSAYTNGTFSNRALTGGTGTGASATIIIAGGVVTSVSITAIGTGYAVNDVLSATLAGGTGFSITVASLCGNTPYKVKRVEKSRLAANLSSTYDAPNSEFPIYTQFSGSFQFYPIDINIASTVILQQPAWSFWAYKLQGYISTLTGLVGGSGYVNGTYSNVPLTGGRGNSALATITVAGGAVTSVVLTNPGKLYAVNDVLSALAANIGGSGAGFSVTVSSLVAGTIRPIYDSASSVQPRWNSDDISTIIDLALADYAINSRDREVAGFSENAQKSQQ